MKQFNVTQDYVLSSLVGTPIRSKTDIINILIYTVRMDLLYYSNEDIPSEIQYHCDKHNRFIYQVTTKRSFSISCPFSVRSTDSGRRWSLQDEIIDYTTLVIISSFLTTYQDNQSLVDQLFDFMVANDEAGMHKIYSIIEYLFHFDYGYIRYDDDIENHDITYHPRFHLDINYSNSSQFKIGLRSKMDVSNLLKLINVNEECEYIEN